MRELIKRRAFALILCTSIRARPFAKFRISSDTVDYLVGRRVPGPTAIPEATLIGIPVVLDDRLALGEVWLDVPAIPKSCTEKSR